jgi:hypothetical protein
VRITAYYFLWGENRLKKRFDGLKQTEVNYQHRGNRRELQNQNTDMWKDNKKICQKQGRTKSCNRMPGAAAEGTVGPYFAEGAAFT